jgi:hypothetical protein
MNEQIHAGGIPMSQRAGPLVLFHFAATMMAAPAQARFVALQFGLRVVRIGWARATLNRAMC